MSVTKKRLILTKETLTRLTDLSSGFVVGGIVQQPKDSGDGVCAGSGDAGTAGGDGSTYDVTCNTNGGITYRQNTNCASLCICSNVSDCLCPPPPGSGQPIPACVTKGVC